MQKSTIKYFYNFFSRALMWQN